MAHNQAMTTTNLPDYDDSDEYYDYEEGPSCSICDGLGHGYPGGPPCPLEMRGEEGVPWWAQ